MNLGHVNVILAWIVEQVAGDDNDPDMHGMDAMTRKRLKVKEKVQGKQKNKPQRPLRSHMPYGLRKDD